LINVFGATFYGQTASQFEKSQSRRSPGQQQGPQDETKAHSDVNHSPEGTSANRIVTGEILGDEEIEMIRSWRVRLRSASRLVGW
jgi:hypothetical protein